MTKQNRVSGSIGIFDSGLGGLSVWREIARQLPGENTLYVADQAHVPYGSRSMDEIRSFCEAIAVFLLEQGAKIVVIACNAASAAALHYLRKLYPDVAFVGMEPAVKPAVKNTRTGVVGVLATQTTFQGKLFESLIAAYGNHARVVTCVGHGLVENVESGAVDTLETEKLLKECMDPLLSMGADQLVLGCTHYQFLMPLIRKLAGSAVSIIDPAPAVALQTARVMKQRQLINTNQGKGRHVFLTTGKPETFKSNLERLITPFTDKWETGGVNWQSGCLVHV